MSAFARHPLRSEYEVAAKAMTPFGFAGGRKHISPQNRRVRFAVDTDKARETVFPNRVTRQQRRAAHRLGYRVETHNPAEVAD